jgi:hypothetical protein
VLDKATIDGVDVPTMWRGTTETWEEEPWFCSACKGCCWCGKAPPTAACEWLAGWSTPLVWWREKSAAAAKSIREKERRVMIAKSSNTKLRKIMRLNLLVSQSFLFIHVGQYIIVKVEITTLEYAYSIFHLGTFYNNSLVLVYNFFMVYYFL